MLQPILVGNFALYPILSLCYFLPFFVYLPQFLLVLCFSPTSSFFVSLEFKVFLSGFFLFIQHGSAEKPKFTIFVMFSFLSQDFIKVKFLERWLTDSAFNTVLSHNISVSIEGKSSQITQCADLASTNGESGHCRDV